jgi:hypothetical protein
VKTEGPMRKPTLGRGAGALPVQSLNVAVNGNLSSTLAISARSSSSEQIGQEPEKGSFGWSITVYHLGLVRVSGPALFHSLRAGLTARNLIALLQRSYWPVGNSYSNGQSRAQSEFEKGHEAASRRVMRRIIAI